MERIAQFPYIGYLVAPYLKRFPHSMKAQFSLETAPCGGKRQGLLFKNPASFYNKLAGFETGRDDFPAFLAAHVA